MLIGILRFYVWEGSVFMLSTASCVIVTFGGGYSEQGFEANLAQATEAQAEAVLQKLVVLFGLKGVNLEFDSACPELYGCYFPATNTINLNTVNGKVFFYVIMHEYGHALQAAYTGDQGFSYQQGEGFGRWMESLYLVTDGAILDFKCPCGKTILRLLPDGTLECISCGTQFFAELYDPSTLPSVTKGLVS